MTWADNVITTIDVSCGTNGHVKHAAIYRYIYRYPPSSDIIDRIVNNIWFDICLLERDITSFRILSACNLVLFNDNRLASPRDNNALECFSCILLISRIRSSCFLWSSSLDIASGSLPPSVKGGTWFSSLKGRSFYGIFFLRHNKTDLYFQYFGTYFVE